MSREQLRKILNKHTRCCICNKRIKSVEDFLLYEGMYKMHQSCKDHQVALVRAALRMHNVSKEH